MTSSNYRYSHEQHTSPDRATMLARVHTLESAAKYLNEVAIHSDPSLWTQGSTESAGGLNLQSPDFTPRPQTTVAAVPEHRTILSKQPRATEAGTMIVRGTAQEQMLADARQLAAEEAL